jgi:hypothetical protein
MRRYSTAKARAEFSTLLDAAENGEVILIERRGVRFSLRSEGRNKPNAKRRRSHIEHVDPAILEGQWTWTLGTRGLRFRRKARR